MTLSLDEIRQRAVSAIESAQRLIGHAFGNGGERPRLSIPARPDYDDDLIVCDAIGKIGPLCSEVERLKAENAKLREVAQRVVSDFPPYQEIEHVDNGPDDPKEVPTGELLCGSCAQGLDDHDAHCLYAMAERALDNGVAPTKEDSVEPVSDESTIGEGTR